MFKLAVNLTLLFTETPFLERMPRARAAGFRYVEFHNPLPFDHHLDDVVAAVRKAGVRVIHFNLPVPGWNVGERGIAARPDLVGEFRSSIARAIETARALDCHQINCPVGNRHPSFALEEQQQVLTQNLCYAAGELARAGITLLLEPLNPITHPTNLLTTTKTALELQDQVCMSNIKIQYDYYQMQRSEGELAETVRRHLDRIGFVQLADAPGRHQPGTGEINFHFLLPELIKSGYSNYLSLEYIPLGTSEESLSWLGEYGLVPGA